MLAQKAGGALVGPPATAVLLPRHSAATGLQRRRRAAAMLCAQQGSSSSPRLHQQEPERESLALLVLKAGMLAMAANALAACTPPPAQAGWTPRRHISNTLRERHVSHETPKQAAERKAAQKQAAKAQAAARQVAQEESMSGLQRVWRETRGKLRDAWRQKPVYSVGQSGRAQAYSRPGAAPSATPLGWVPLVLAGVAAAALLWGRNLGWPWGGGGRRGTGGRWVRDRSLGGKMVFIPDVDLSEAGGNGKKAARPLFEDDAESAVAAAAVAPSTAAGPWATAAAAAPAARRDEPPSWWDEPNFLMYTTFARKEELQRQARVVLRQLEDAKLLQGLDYPITGLVELRTLCQEAGGYQVKPRTESGRDALLRAGVQAAIQAGQEGRYALLGGDLPAKFVCGLAHDLGVPDKRAATIVHAEVAALCRAALIDAEAAYRAGSQGDLLLALARLAGALQTFPLPPGSAEAELVAAGVVKQTSLEFRRAIFLEFGAVSLPMAALVAEMLGFNPDLVMPELQRQVAQAAANALAGLGGGGGGAQGPAQPGQA